MSRKNFKQEILLRAFEGDAATPLTIKEQTAWNADEHGDANKPKRSPFLRPDGQLASFFAMTGRFGVYSLQFCWLRQDTVFCLLTPSMDNNWLSRWLPCIVCACWTLPAVGLLPLHQWIASKRAAVYASIKKSFAEPKKYYFVEVKIKNKKLLCNY